MPIDFQQVRELLAAIANTDIVELQLKDNDFELTVRKGGAAMPTVASDGVSVAMIPSPPAVVPPPSPSPPPVESPAPPTVDPKWVEITSPMVGTFYRAPAPDEPPFVDVGEAVRVGQTVCIIEAMKLMNEIESEVAGQIVEVLVANGESVEYGQVLMRVNPN
ncbi:acetyl-CoA carboxylase biotin carboxyl carrier protein [Spirulina subsalsa FACHB-351]|uniref:Biotin carboxyl carrier protein of acetyl-CoA carboxylase n=1 Tax=Spirulina subsalsa FACHB-351 TaxID=234711 RepID=A0ABT3L583_9CYAN|nr:acetyl-CoA carboxylase biotin carboxyl carrier protein [Spirulina subsalsa]MCW6036617.1 acetyl-CoA carboxylase biotin carboxyl carrier protein [Spirulina subsalsa FACHB-351]